MTQVINPNASDAPVSNPNFSASIHGHDANPNDGPDALTCLALIPTLGEYSVASKAKLFVVLFAPVPSEPKHLLGPLMSNSLDPRLPPIF